VACIIKVLRSLMMTLASSVTGILIDNARVIIYDRNVLIIQATGVFIEQFSNSISCGLYYKPITIVNDDSSIVSKLETSLIDDARFVIYDCNMFIVQSTGVFIEQFSTSKS
jgi:hypothetical protein